MLQNDQTKPSSPHERGPVLHTSLQETLSMLRTIREPSLRNPSCHFAGLTHPSDRYKRVLSFLVFPLLLSPQLITSIFSRFLFLPDSSIPYPSLPLLSCAPSHSSIIANRLLLLRIPDSREQTLDDNLSTTRPSAHFAIRSYLRSVPTRTSLSLQERHLSSFRIIHIC